MRAPRVPMRVTVVEVPATPMSVQVGDVIVIGGARFTILNMATVPGGMKRLTFTTGDSLTLRATTPLYCERPFRYRRTLPRRRW